MLTKEDLIKQFSTRVGKVRVVMLSRILAEQGFALCDLTDLSFHHDRDIAFRAAWVLENMFMENPASYEADIEYLISRIGEIKHASCQRHYAKILMHATGKRSPPAIQKKLQQINLEPAVEQCFDWMIDPEILIAVKVFSSEALFNLRHRYPWITEELKEQIQFLMKNGTAAIQSRGKKLLGLMG